MTLVVNVVLYFSADNLLCIYIQFINARWLSRKGNIIPRNRPRECSVCHSLNHRFIRCRGTTSPLSRNGAAKCIPTTIRLHRYTRLSPYLCQFNLTKYYRPRALSSIWDASTRSSRCSSNATSYLSLESPDQLSNTLLRGALKSTYLLLLE